MTSTEGRRITPRQFFTTSIKPWVCGRLGGKFFRDDNLGDTALGRLGDNRQDIWATKMNFVTTTEQPQRPWAVMGIHAACIVDLHSRLLVKSVSKMFERKRNFHCCSQ